MIIQINDYLEVEFTPSQAAKERVSLYRRAHIDIPEGSDYKDVAALKSAAIANLAFREDKEYLIIEMPDGVYCPRSFDAWWDEQFFQAGE